MLIRMLIAAGLLAVASSVPSLTVAEAEGSPQSFDCGKAQTRTEKLVCADRSVA